MSADLTSQLTPTELEFIDRAADYLEHPSFLLRVANLVGKPVEVVGQVLPARVRDAAAEVVTRALTNALEVALSTLTPADGIKREVEEFEADSRRDRLKHNVAAGLTGALAGSFGIMALALELPITTTIMMRNIAGVATGFGEDVNDREVKLQCLAVFSIGGDIGSREGALSAMESSYYASRLALGNLIREAAEYVARISAQELVRDLSRGASPALVRFIAQIASRFNVVVSQKLMAQAVPAIGAVGGALVNVAFNNHFDRVARYHFGIRALERKYGKEPLQAAYQAAVKKRGERSVKIGK